MIDPVMTEIVLIRHGETAWNAEARMQGHLDIGLNARGREQAALLADRLRDERFDAVIASDLSRAFDTAQIVAAGRNVAIVSDPALRERCFGAFEGLLYAEIDLHFPDAWEAWHARDADARYPAGDRVAETLREFSARVLAAVTGHAQRHLGRRIAVFTHGGVLDCVYRSAHGIALEQPRNFDLANTAVNRMRWDGRILHPVTWGDVSHLQQRALDEMVE